MAITVLAITIRVKFLLVRRPNLNSTGPQEVKHKTYKTRGGFLEWDAKIIQHWFVSMGKPTHIFDVSVSQTSIPLKVGRFCTCTL